MADAMRCPLCGKMVRDKPLFGSLHVCVTDEEEKTIRRRWEVARWQLTAQQRDTAGWRRGLTE